MCMNDKDSILTNIFIDSSHLKQSFLAIEISNFYSSAVFQFYTIQNENYRTSGTILIHCNRTGKGDTRI